jgi:DNA-directed RNA polymerase sigma subunit (sigma70/sigma32)
MRRFLGPTEDGWPYADGLEGPSAIDVAGEADDDLLALRLDKHLLDDLDPVERRVISASFGLDGVPLRTLPQLHDELGLPNAMLEGAMGSGLAKLRAHLRA